MRSKAPLALMEQLVMTLVFALAAALCVQAFAAANRMSESAAARDRAAQLAQSAAEIMKNRGGNMAEAQNAAMEALGGQVEQSLWYVLYDRDWNEVTPAGGEEEAYRLYVYLPAPPDPALKLWRAGICVSGKDGEDLIVLPVAWQEVDGGA